MKRLMVTVSLGLLFFVSPEARAACGSQDVRNSCCPAACDAKKDPKNKDKANEVLRACMKRIGCVSYSSATVFSYCSCK
jgi:hypothetical protein